MEEYAKQTKVLLVLLIVLVGFSFVGAGEKKQATNKTSTEPLSSTGSQVIPDEGIVLPIAWNDIGKKMVYSGVIDEQKMEGLYQNRGGLSPEEREILYGQESGKIVMTKDNAQFLLNMLWAFGLSNKNKILEEGEMTDARYGGDASRFASTGGWTLSTGSPMDHYSRHQFVVLTDNQQQKVEQVSKNIYRPCCGNSTHFPDCNHGMAMLGLLELLAAEDLSEEEMYEIALSVNSYWFPDTYLTLAKYFDDKMGTDWSDVDPKTALGASYSSAQGYRRVQNEISPVQNQGGNGCSV